MLRRQVHLTMQNPDCFPTKSAVKKSIYKESCLIPMIFIYFHYFDLTIEKKTVKVQKLKGHFSGWLGVECIQCIFVCLNAYAMFS